MAQYNPWFVTRQAGSPRVRLYCFSYAGGNASAFLPWQRALGPAIGLVGVQLPGRGARVGEQLYTSFSTLIADLVPAFLEHMDRPSAFFGHSLGALVAFEVARHLATRRLNNPLHLFASGCASPRRQNTSARLGDLEDDALLATLREYNGTPAEALNDRELMQLVLPAVRADFKLADTYVYSCEEPKVLDIPISVFAGKRDVDVAPQDLFDWKLETKRICRAKWFDGDHFFINSDVNSVLTCLRFELSRYGGV